MEEANLKQHNNLFLEIFGWYGSIAIIAAYFLNSFGLLDATGALYQILNVTGALGIIAISWYKKVYQSVALNIVWMVIAAVALTRIFF